MLENMKLRYKIAAGVATAAAVVAGGGAAFAYFSSTGAGSGSATTGLDATTVAISDNGSFTGLVPGGPAKNITVTATAPAAESAYVSGITAWLTVTEGNPGSGITGYTCSSADYLLDGTANTSSSSTVPVAGWTATDIVAGQSASTTAAANSIQFNDLSGTAQDACQGATVTIHYKSN